MCKDWTSGQILKLVNIRLEEKMPVTLLETLPATNIQMKRSTSVDQP